MIDIHYNFDNLSEFYSQCEIVKDFGNIESWERLKSGKSFESNFVGIEYSEINNVKYSYKPPTESNEDKELLIGSKAFRETWNDYDGEAFSFERYIEDLPYLKCKKTKDGNKNGKFITIWMNITENCYVSPKAMQNKANNVMKLIDALESNNFRIKLITFAYIENPGMYEIQDINKFLLTITIKDFEESLIKNKIYTCISTWFFRYYMFLFFHSHFNSNFWLGRPVRCDFKNTKKDIFINSGEFHEVNIDLDNILSSFVEDDTIYED